jgi:hypothetical protein
LDSGEDAPVSDGATTDRALEGDAGAQLEELVVGQLPRLVAGRDPGNSAEVEVVSGHLRLRGTLYMGVFRRVSDFLNSNPEGLIPLRNVTVLRRNGQPTKVTSPSMWVTPSEVSLVAVRAESAGVDPTMQAPRTPMTIVAVTPGHTLTGDLHMVEGALLSVVIQSPTPAFLTLTDVRTRSLADRRVITRYDVAMLNRRHVVAATELLPGMDRIGL